MSDRDDDQVIIRNEDTVARRAWVERALDCVRRRLENGEAPPAPSQPEERPPLYVVPSGRRR
jgi:hypothetical protein